MSSYIVHAGVPIIFVSHIIKMFHISCCLPIIQTITDYNQFEWSYYRYYQWSFHKTFILQYQFCTFLLDEDDNSRRYDVMHSSKKFFIFVTLRRMKRKQKANISSWRSNSEPSKCQPLTFTNAQVLMSTFSYRTAL